MTEPGAVINRLRWPRRLRRIGCTAAVPVRSGHLGLHIPGGDVHVVGLILLGMGSGFARSLATQSAPKGNR